MRERVGIRRVPEERRFLVVCYCDVDRHVYPVWVLGAHDGGDLNLALPSPPVSPFLLFQRHPILGKLRRELIGGLRREERDLATDRKDHYRALGYHMKTLAPNHSTVYAFQGNCIFHGKSPRF